MATNLLFPAFLDLKDLPCLVVGGGSVAAQKTKQLLKARARVTIVSPDLVDALARLADDGQLHWIARKWVEDDLFGARLVIAATGDFEIEAAIAREATRRGLFINVVDRPALSSFIMGAVLEQDDLKIAISTNGQSPTLAKKLRDHLALSIGPEWRQLLELAGRLRRHALSLPAKSPKERRAFFERLVSESSLELLRAGRHQELLEQIERWLGAPLP